MIPILYTDDIKKTLDFYVNTLEMKLGCAIYEDEPYKFNTEPDMEDDSRRMTLLLLRSSIKDAIFYRDIADTNEDVAKALKATPGSGAQFYIRVDNLRHIYDKLRAEGKVEIIAEPFLSWQQETFEEFSIRDCNGYIISFAQNVAPKEEEK